MKDGQNSSQAFPDAQEKRESKGSACSPPYSSPPLQMKSIAEETNYKNSEFSKAVDEYIHSERDRKILKRRFIDGLTYEELAGEFLLDIRTCQRIVQKLKPKVFAHIS